MELPKQTNTFLTFFKLMDIIANKVSFKPDLGCFEKGQKQAAEACTS